MKLTKDELWDLAQLAWGYADRNDDDDGVWTKYNALYEKLVEMAKREAQQRGSRKRVG